MSIKWLDSREWKQRLANNDSDDFTHAEDGDPYGVRKLLTPEIEVKDSDDDNNRSLRFIISSNAVDRDGDTIKQSGWELENYLKNPVVLWAHDSRSPPVAKASDIEIRGNKRLVANAEFVPREISPFADMVYQMYREKFLSATSVGFIPLEMEESRDEDRGDGFFMPFDIKRQELLEFSAVPVPSNPEALVQARKSGIDTEPLKDWAEEQLDTWSSRKNTLPFGYKEVEAAYRASKGNPSTSVRSSGGIFVPIHVGAPVYEESQASTSRVRLSDGNSDGASTGAKQVDITVKDQTTDKAPADTDKQKDSVKGPILWRQAHPEGTPAVSKDMSWCGADVRKNLSDDRGQWVRTFAWVDPTAADNDDDGLADDKSAWKLPHHKESENSAVVWNGVVASMASLMGAGGGVDIPASDRRSIYNHLARHYREDFHEVPPDFESVDHQLLASEEYVMNRNTGRPEKAATAEGAEEVDETDLALEQSVDGSEEKQTTVENTVGEPEGEGVAKDTVSGGYQFTVRLGDIESVCTVNSFEELKEVMNEFNQNNSQKDNSTTGTETTTEGGAEKSVDNGAQNGDQVTDKGVEGALESLDLDALIEKYGEDEVLEMLPDIAKEVVDSMLDQATGRVH